ncbi:sugar-binding protein [Butyrivibrio sp. INlla16]|uniref:substrate-binding domain-containing protein n=1 Tax=Butyrivibrio sp. INlla16 TaxID=1520807 RepID=UPI0008923F5A|nr:sugar-binding protein [Butyrivibrio sp. INlla16]SDB06030.1 putative multiple sugar transport system substrate-binding protein [Butyrivibrio sp. INlla16]
MIKRLLSAFLITSLASLSLAGCVPTKAVSGDTAQTEAEPTIIDAHSDDGRTVVGISMPDNLLERWNRDGLFLKDEFKKAGCDVELKYANNLIDTQINDLREMIEDGADLLVIAAVDGAALTSILDEAKQANVKIIAYDRLLMNTDSVDYYVSFDNYKVGVLQADFIIDKLGLEEEGAEKNIEFVTGDPVDNNARFFYQGAMDNLQPYIDSGKLKVLSTQTGFYETSTAQWSTDIAQQRLQIILNSYYPPGTRLDAVLCANDSTALGAVRALESDYPGTNTVLVTGQDGDIANIYNIFEGTQSMTVYKALQQESIVTVSLGTALLSGETPDYDLIDNSSWDFECAYNTKDYNNGIKVVNSYLLQPYTITIDNIEKELFDTGYYARNASGLIYAVK